MYSLQYLFNCFTSNRPQNKALGNNQSLQGVFPIALSEGLLFQAEFKYIEIGLLNNSHILELGDELRISTTT